LEQAVLVIKRRIIIRWCFVSHRNRFHKMKSMNLTIKIIRKNRLFTHFCFRFLFNRACVSSKCPSREMGIGWPLGSIPQRYQKILAIYSSN
jgi:hypothetical protein